MANSHQKVLNLIEYVKTSDTSYSAKKFKIGYHSIELDGTYYRGQRDCHKRLVYIEKEMDFNGKNVLDIGCCIGGMLFPLADKINSGIGIDFNHKNINAGNRVARYKKLHHLAFYEFNLDTENLDLIHSMYDHPIDVVFLFAVCMWITKWRQLIDFISDLSPILFIETNGSNVQQKEQLEYVSLKYPHIKTLYTQSLDDPGQPHRKLYMCKK